MIVAVAQIVAEVDMADAMTELPDKIKYSLLVPVPDIGMSAVQGELQIRKALQNICEVCWFKKSLKSGKHIFQTHLDAKSIGFCYDGFQALHSIVQCHIHNEICEPSDVPGV